ncbi:nitrite reductase small subunit [Burkholderia sp. ABCPW 14]|uniref:nitrite reductase small subunit NirD n=1 Tax=Burkholderia sp. ABCPW 14 TaxID=1637860 RepID=UPI000770C439|nr:nitrite reductase small subunit NirD [Burkholderia sp. ABCPW 14]KVD74128.1 nitrite reductase small subunit [Burkholderia sp. ABCPW 14]
MSSHRDASAWTPVCALDDIVPNTGVCALVNGEQVAVFHVDDGDGHGRAFAIGNVDPHSQAAVLSRGLIGSLGERIVVASPLYKHHFDLRTGECLEAPDKSVNAYPSRIEDGYVWIAA